MNQRRGGELWCFNTASGKHYCNETMELTLINTTFVSFNTASGKHYCNRYNMVPRNLKLKLGFNTASGKHYCNVVRVTGAQKAMEFQYRKR